jgi:hypothetical protein
LEWRAFLARLEALGIEVDAQDKQHPFEPAARKPTSVPLDLNEALGLIAGGAPEEASRL